MKGFRFAYLATAVVLAAAVSIVSSCSSNPSSILIGTWRQDVTYSGVPSNLPSSYRFQYQFNKDNSFEIDMYVILPGETSWVLFTGQKGTYSVSGDIVTGVPKQEYVLDPNTMTGSWGPASSTQPGTMQYSCSGTTLIVTLDLNQDGKYDTSHPIQDNYPGGTGPTTDVTLTLTKI